jgi:hypothetical protein
VIRNATFVLLYATLHHAMMKVGRNSSFGQQAVIDNSSGERIGWHYCAASRRSGRRTMTETMQGIPSCMADTGLTDSDCTAVSRAKILLHSFRVRAFLYLFRVRGLEGKSTDRWASGLKPAVLKAAMLERASQVQILPYPPISTALHRARTRCRA